MKKKKPHVPASRSADGSEPRIRARVRPALCGDSAYRATLPDMMEAANDAIDGANVPHPASGCLEFQTAAEYRTKKGGILTLERAFTGTVSLRSRAQGINMSRIVRSFYAIRTRSSRASGWARSSSVPAQREGKGRAI